MAEGVIILSIFRLIQLCRVWLGSIYTLFLEAFASFVENVKGILVASFIQITVVFVD